jgi:pimeloyl-ACP methyl ester carboxylesterase
MRVKSDDTEILYELRGSGAPVILLHPFPANHHFWDGCAPFLETRYQLITPDLRAHGDSPPGEGPATMIKHAQDLARLCDELKLVRAAFVGCSIGGYVLFEFWRRFRDRIAALIFSNTRAGEDSPDQRAAREKQIQDVNERGPSALIEPALPKMLSETSMRSHPDRAEAARTLMSHMSVKGIGSALQGLAVRPDSTATLKTINVPTLIIAGAEDTLTPRSEAEIIHQGIAGSRLEIVPGAGHYAPLEEPEEWARIVRAFLDQTTIGN